VEKDFRTAQSNEKAVLGADCGLKSPVFCIFRNPVFGNGGQWGGVEGGRGEKMSRAEEAGDLV
jgi:hypothetical protein